MAIEDDIAVDASGVFIYTGSVHGAVGAGYYTVIEFHRFAQALADDATATGDDLIDITVDTPSERSTDNIIKILTGFSINEAGGTDNLAEHLYDGTIFEEDSGTVWDGMLVLANEGMDLQLLQDGAQVTNDFWNTIPFGESEKGLNRDAANGISHRFLFKVNAGGTEIDGRRLVGMTRVIGKTFSEFKINGTASGNNVLALTFADDLNDTTDASGRVSITNSEGYSAVDVDNNSVDENYYSEWNKDIYTINEFYERMKYISRGEAANVATLYGIDAKIFRGITHEVALSGGAGTWVEPESLSWGTGSTAGTGQLLAVDDLAGNGSTKLWMQILTGVAPNANTITGNGGATATVGVVTERVVSNPFVGVSTGTSLIGAYGLGLEAADLSAADKVFDLNNTQVTPPNNVTFSVSGVTPGEDRILVGPKAAGTALMSDQFSIQGALSGGESSVTLSAGLETPGTGTNSEIDTPSTGTIRLQGSDGVYHRVTYTSVSHGAGSITFAGCIGVPSATDSNNAYISYIDKLASSTSESFTVVYAADRELFIRVRDGGVSPIKTFQTGGSLGSGGGSTSAIRTSDA